MRPAFVGYIAASADGLVATPDGGVAWLDAFAGADFGYEAFLAGIGPVVMGRATYDQVLGFGEWPYPGHRTLVLTSRPLGDAPEGVEAWSGGAAGLADRLAAEPQGGDVWVCGGPRTLAAFLEAGALDRLQVFVMPVLLGAGLPLFPPGVTPRPLHLEESRSWDGGVVSLTWRVGQGARGAA